MVVCSGCSRGLSSPKIVASADYWPSNADTGDHDNARDSALADTVCDTSELAARPPRSSGLGGARGVAAATAVGAQSCHEEELGDDRSRHCRTRAACRRG